jgi:hypothetical protein
MAVIKKYNDSTSQWEAIAIGEKGDTGEGVPSGGSAGQVLAKASGTNYDAGWINPYTIGGSGRIYNNNGTYFGSADGAVMRGPNTQGLSTPYRESLQRQGDWQFIVKVRMDDWTPPEYGSVAGEYILGTGSHAEANGTIYHIRVNSDGTLQFSRDQFSQIARLFVSTVPTGLADGADKWIKVEFRQNNGSAQSQCEFFLGDDGATWTKLGATLTNNNTGNAPTNTGGNGRLTFGRVPNPYPAGQGTMHGRIYYAKITNDFVNNPVVVLEANFTSPPVHSLLMQESSSFTSTITLENLSNYGFGIPSIGGHTTTTTRTLASRVIYYHPFIVSESVTIDMVRNEVTTYSGANPTTIVQAIYSADADFMPVGAPVVVVPEQTISTNQTGIRYVFLAQPVTIQPGRYLFAINHYNSTNTGLILRHYRFAQSINSMYVTSFGGSMSSGSGAGASFISEVLDTNSSSPKKWDTMQNWGAWDFPATLRWGVLT